MRVENRGNGHTWRMPAILYADRGDWRKLQSLHRAHLANFADCREVCHRLYATLKTRVTRKFAFGFRKTRKKKSPQQFEMPVLSKTGESRSRLLVTDNLQNSNVIFPVKLSSLNELDSSSPTLHFKFGWIETVRSFSKALSPRPYKKSLRIAQQIFSTFIA